MRRVEVELKLEVDPGDLGALVGASYVKAVAWETHRLFATYFDTPDRAVWRSGHSLRVRRQERRHVQAVKARGAGAVGLLAREEWERIVPGDAPMIDAESGPLLDAIGSARAGLLAPVFVTDVERTVRHLEFEGADLEFSIDRGMVRTDDRAAPIAEVELELRGGDMRALFDFARRLDGHVPLRLAVRSKPERGYALLDGTASEQAPAKARPVSMDPAMTAADALRAILLSCLRDYRLNETLLLGSDDSEALHQARVALRRLRTAFSLFRPLLSGDSDVRRIDAEFRRLAVQLGDARNLDVLIARFGKRVPPSLARARNGAYEHVRAELESARVRILLLDLLEWLGTGRWLEAPKHPDRLDEPIPAFAARRLDRHRRRLKRLGRGLDHRGARRAHRVRIEAKKARYASEFLASLWPSSRARERYGAWIDELERLQDRLGELNDIAVGQHILTALGLAAPEAPAHHASTLRADARAALGKLVATPRFWTEVDNEP